MRPLDTSGLEIALNSALREERGSSVIPRSAYPLAAHATSPRRVVETKSGWYGTTRTV